LGFVGFGVCVVWGWGLGFGIWGVWFIRVKDVRVWGFKGIGWYEGIEFIRV